MNNSFVAIDFETATFARNSACAVGIVTVENGIITERYYTLIKPPNNEYFDKCIQVHDIRPADTRNSLTFKEVFPEILSRLKGKIVVAHNEVFDRSVLRACVNELNEILIPLDLDSYWECTLKIYRKKGYKPCRLSDCCNALGIELNHHQALSDAVACAELYLRR